MSEWSESELKSALQRVLASHSFARSGQLKRLLNYVVSATIEHREETLKESVIGVEVLDLATDFDPKSDPVVRMAMRRLRSRLALYYTTEGIDEPIVITLKPGRYAPQFLTKNSGRHDTISVAILPFENLPESEADSDHAALLRSALISRLQTHTFLRPIASEYIPQMIPPGSDSRVFQQQLPAQFFVRGTCFVANENLQIFIELLGFESDETLWSGQHQQAAGQDVWTVQNQIAAELQRSVSAALNRKEVIAPTPYMDQGVHRLLVQGRHLLNQNSANSIRKSEQCFLAVIQKQPESAKAWAGYSAARSCMAVFQLESPVESWEKARIASERALELDSTVPEGYLARGLVEALRDFRPSSAGTSFQLALGLNPNDHSAKLLHAMMSLVPAGNLVAAEEEIESVLASDPLDAKALQFMAAVLYYQRRYESSTELALSALDLMPHSASASFILANSYDRLGFEEAALKQFRRCEELMPFLRVLKWPVVLSAIYKGRSKWARPGLIALSKLLQASPRAPSAMLADLLIRVGEHDRALFWMERAFKQRLLRALYFCVDPAFDSIQADPRSVKLASHIKTAPPQAEVTAMTGA
jgi:adenylate cyclase